MVILSLPTIRHLRCPRSYSKYVHQIINLFTSSVVPKLFEPRPPKRSGSKLVTPRRTCMPLRTRTIGAQMQSVITAINVMHFQNARYSNILRFTPAFLAESHSYQQVWISCHIITSLEYRVSRFMQSTCVQRRLRLQDRMESMISLYRLLLIHKYCISFARICYIFIP